MLFRSQVWVRMKGIPSRHKGDFLALWGLGSLLGKTIKVDMPYTREHGVLRILIGCVNVLKIPKELPVFIKDGFYDITFEVEEHLLDEDMLGANGEDDDLSDGQGNEKTRKSSKDGKSGEVIGNNSVSSNSSIGKRADGSGNSGSKQVVSKGVFYSPRVAKSLENIRLGRWEEFPLPSGDLSVVQQIKEAEHIIFQSWRANKVVDESQRDDFGVAPPFGEDRNEGCEQETLLPSDIGPVSSVLEDTHGSLCGESNVVAVHNDVPEEAAGGLLGATENDHAFSATAVRAVAAENSPLFSAAAEIPAAPFLCSSPAREATFDLTPNVESLGCSPLKNVSKEDIIQYGGIEDPKASRLRSSARLSARVDGDATDRRAHV